MGNIVFFSKKGCYFSLCASVRYYMVCMFKICQIYAGVCTALRSYYRGRLGSRELERCDIFSCIGHVVHIYQLTYTNLPRRWRHLAHLIRQRKCYEMFIDTVKITRFLLRNQSGEFVIYSSNLQCFLTLPCFDWSSLTKCAEPVARPEGNLSRVCC